MSNPSPTLYLLKYKKVALLRFTSVGPTSLLMLVLPTSVEPTTNIHYATSIKLNLVESRLEVFSQLA